MAEGAAQAERDARFERMFREATNPNAHHLQQIAAGVASLHGAAQAMAAAAAHHASMGNTAAEHIVMAARQAAEAMANARLPQEHPIAPEVEPEIPMVAAQPKRELPKPSAARAESEPRASKRQAVGAYLVGPQDLGAGPAVFIPSPMPTRVPKRPSEAAATQERARSEQPRQKLKSMIIAGTTVEPAAPHTHNESLPLVDIQTPAEHLAPLAKHHNVLPMLALANEPHRQRSRSRGRSVPRPHDESGSRPREVERYQPGEAASSTAHRGNSTRAGLPDLPSRRPKGFVPLQAPVGNAARAAAAASKRASSRVPANQPADLLGRIKNLVPRTRARSTRPVM